MNDRAPAVDMDTLNTLREIMEDKFRLLIDAYLGEAPTLLDQIETAIGANDADALRMAAHSLKSSSGNIGGNGLSDIARELENLGRDGKADATGDLLAQAQQEFSRIEAALNEIKNA
jgi:HPt (histidine-containing phosphotransfer) domain-containing protein